MTTTKLETWRMGNIVYARTYEPMTGKVAYGVSHSQSAAVNIAQKCLEKVTPENLFPNLINFQREPHTLVGRQALCGCGTCEL